MKAKTLTALTLVALLCYSEVSMADVSIRGSPSCGQWIKQQNSAGYNTGKTWLVGYLSGLAMATGEDFWGNAGVNLLDNESAFAWIDKYCQNNPLEGLADAGQVLFVERVNKLKKR